MIVDLSNTYMKTAIERNHLKKRFRGLLIFTFVKTNQNEKAFPFDIVIDLDGNRILWTK